MQLAVYGVDISEVYYHGCMRKCDDHLKVRQRGPLRLFTGLAALALFLGGAGVAGASDIRPVPYTKWFSASVNSGVSAHAQARGRLKTWSDGRGTYTNSADFKLNVKNHKRSDRGGYGDLDSKTSIYKCQPMPGGNCIPGVAPVAKEESTDRVLGADSKTHSVTTRQWLGSDQRGKWHNSAKVCVDLVMRPDKCTEVVHW